MHTLSRANETGPWDETKISVSLTFKSDNAIGLLKEISVNETLWSFPPPKYIRDAFAESQFFDGDDGGDSD
jgi:hypothetical protein